jgi:putative transposase
MPNHFHFLLMQKQAQGIVGFMNSLQLGHAKYFNTKYSRVGPLYQGRFKAKIIEEDEYLLYVSAYIHRNPIAGLLDSGNRSNSRNLNRLVTFVRDYPYSSYREYLYPQENILAKTEAISEFFSSTNPQLTYSSFVENFTLDIEMLIPHLADT